MYMKSVHTKESNYIYKAFSFFGVFVLTVDGKIVL